MLALTAALAVTSPAAGTAATTTASPTADTYVREDKPSNNYGTSDRLRSDGSPRVRSYLRFNVQGTSGTVTKATLRFYAQSRTSTGVSAYRVADTSWSETGMTWSTAPAPGSTLSSSGPITSGTWVALDVTPLVSGDGPVAMALATAASTQAAVASRETGSTAPQLVVESTQPAGTPPPADTTPPATPTGLTATPGDGSVTLDWADNAEADLAGYRVYRRNADGTWPASPTASPTTSTWTDSGLTNGTGYTYRVTAVDQAGNESAPTAAVSATPASSSAADLQAPIRGAFYYPWFPETWTVGGQHVFYNPSLGYYDSDDQATVDAHVRALEHGRIEAAIASWWGVGKHNEQVRLPLLFDRTSALGSGLRWAPYYEPEGSGDPPVSTLQADLAYLEDHYMRRPAAARLNGKPVIFVYNAGDTSCSLVDRWQQATAGRWYVVLKVFTGWQNCPSQPDAWHQYGPSTGTHSHDKSYVISPGFWRADEPAPQLARDPAAWRQRVRDMVASGKPWQLVTTFNEWGEGTAVESAGEWSSASGHGTYLDALHDDGAEPAPAGAPVIAGAGDIADADFDAEKTAKLLDAINPDVVYTTGDNAYPNGTASDFDLYYQPTWGRHKAKTKPTPGNHEYITPGAAGYFGYFGALAADPAKGYYAYDLAGWRLYALNSSVSMAAGSAQEQWLRADLAANPRTCALAYWHHPRFSAGNYADDTSLQPIWQTLYDAGAELVMNGHDHNYQRYTPMRPDGTVDAARGIREYVIGSGGKNHYPLSPRPDGKREAGNDTAYGVLKLTLRAGAYDWQFVPEAGATYTDSGTGTCH